MKNNDPVEEANDRHDRYSDVVDAIRDAVCAEVDRLDARISGHDPFWSSNAAGEAWCKLHSTLIEMEELLREEGENEHKNLGN